MQTPVRSSKTGNFVGKVVRQNPYNLTNPAPDAAQYYQRVIPIAANYAAGYAPTLVTNINQRQAEIVTGQDGVPRSSFGSMDFALNFNQLTDPAHLKKMYDQNAANTCVGSSCYIANEAGALDDGALENATWARRVADDKSWLPVEPDQAQPGDRLVVWWKNNKGKPETVAYKHNQLRGLDKELNMEGYYPGHMVIFAGKNKSDTNKIRVFSDGSQESSYAEKEYKSKPTPDTRYLLYRYVGSPETAQRYKENQQQPDKWKTQNLNPYVLTRTPEDIKARQQALEAIPKEQRLGYTQANTQARQQQASSQQQQLMAEKKAIEAAVEQARVRATKAGPERALGQRQLTTLQAQLQVILARLTDLPNVPTERRGGLLPSYKKGGQVIWETNDEKRMNKKKRLLGGGVTPYRPGNLTPNTDNLFRVDPRFRPRYVTGRSVSGIADMEQVNQKQPYLPVSIPTLARRGGLAPPLTPVTPGVTGGAPANEQQGERQQDGKQPNGVDPFRLINAGLGIAGALSYATAKAPKLAAPAKFTPVIAQTSYAPEREAFARKLAQQTAAFDRPQTSDAMTNMLGRLSAGSQANESQRRFDESIGERQRQDAISNAAIQNNAGQINYQTAENDRQQRYQMAQNNYAQRRQAGQAMAQSALTYEAQRSATKQQAGQTAQDRQNRLEEYAFEQQLRNSSPAQVNELLARLRKPPVAGRSGMSLPVIFKNGGRMKTGKTTSYSSKKTTRSKIAKVEEQFAQRLHQVTLQTMRQFSRSIEQALK